MPWLSWSIAAALLLRIMTADSLTNCLPPRHSGSHNHPAGQGPACSPGWLQHSPVEWEMHNCVVYSELLKASAG